jgi:hypothetical protein
MPLFFLDVRNVPREGSLGIWLAAEHHFNLAGAVVLIAQENMSIAVVCGTCDGLVFVEESHAVLPEQ